MTLAELRETPTVKLEEQFYVLRDRDGDYVESVQSTGMETVKLHFAFTKDVEQARVFTYDSLYNRQAVAPVGVLFTQGFSGGRAVPLRKRQ